MSKENNVAFITIKLKAEYDSLKEGKFQDRQLYAYISRALEDLRNNPTCGIKIPRKLWPKEYIQRWQVTNLWKYDLPNGWRLIYTIEADDVKVVSIILEWFDHKSYERRFGY